MKTLLTVLLYIWQLPQNLLGLILRLFYKTDTKVHYREKTIRVCKAFPGGISLGDTVFVNKYPVGKAWSDTKHEWGHTRQSLFLGPLYLIVIGLPSIIWAALPQQKWGISYYAFYTEKWADKLGNVKR